ncbi:MAG TPA: hypothetical protein DEB24_03880 [Coriobacteriia bacterium]|nr:hypothetical protein [Coriobacteriia bacterium]
MGSEQAVIEFPDLKVPIVRGPSRETYLALQPPEAIPYVVAPADVPVEDVARFVHERLDTLKELRADMLKHFSKTNSLKCHFRTGDVTHLIGRPFMLRVNPLSTSARRTRKPTRGLANLNARLYNDLSLIDLFVSQVGNYEQGKAAYLSYAQTVFTQNIKSLLEQCMQRVFPEIVFSPTVKARPMRDCWVKIDDTHGVVWFSENLIPYPPHAVVYAYLVEAIKKFAPDASEEKQHELLMKGVPDWEHIRALLADPNNKYAL